MRSRAGFSLVEALVVLAVGGMALAIIFTIGTKAGDTGFSLGRRAMAAADADIAYSDLRSILTSYLLRPPAAALPDLDRALEGEANRLTGEVVMRRATRCAPRGWHGELILAVEPQGDRQVLTCQAGSSKVILIPLQRGGAAFQYSSDGVDWRDRYSNAPEFFDEPSAADSIDLHVRFVAREDRIDILERLTSGRFERWVRSDVVR